jgi:hypothetical protein
MSDPIYDEEKFPPASPTDNDKARTEQLEAVSGKINHRSPYDRPAHWVDIDPAAEAKLRRKIDIRLVPLCTLLYL